MMRGRAGDAANGLRDHRSFEHHLIESLTVSWIVTQTDPVITAFDRRRAKPFNDRPVADDRPSCARTLDSLAQSIFGSLSE